VPLVWWDPGEFVEFGILSTPSLKEYVQQRVASQATNPPNFSTQEEQRPHFFFFLKKTRTPSLRTPVPPYLCYKSTILCKQTRLYRVQLILALVREAAVDFWVAFFIAHFVNISFRAS
jgi:hypothetical protein